MLYIIWIFGIVDLLQAMSYDGHKTNVTAIGFQRDGKWMFSGSEDHTIKIWDLRFNELKCY